MASEAKKIERRTHRLARLYEKAGYILSKCEDKEVAWTTNRTVHIARWSKLRAAYVDAMNA